MRPIPIETMVGFASPKEAFRTELIAGISAPPHHRRIPSSLSYLAICEDEEENADMDGFQRIMQTREYYQTRAEMDILFGQAAQMAQMLGELRQGHIRYLRIAEREPGDGLKTWLLAALDAAGIPFTYCGIDCSMRALRSFQANQIPLRENSRVYLFCGDADRLLKDRTYLEDTADVLIDFGGNIGNGDANTSLSQACTALPKGGVYLVGWHSREVEPTRILLSYNDRGGVTEQFILNALQQANHLYGGNFSLSCFEYAPSITKDGTVIMALRSLRQQTVQFMEVGLRVTFEQGELLTVSTSCKWFPEEFREWTTAHGLGIKKTFAHPKRKIYVTAVTVPHATSG